MCEPYLALKQYKIWQPYTVALDILLETPNSLSTRFYLISVQTESQTQSCHQLNGTQSGAIKRRSRPLVAVLLALALATLERESACKHPLVVSSLLIIPPKALSLRRH